MGSYVLRGITTALLVTVLTLFGGILLGTMGLGVLSVSQLLDIGLLASCIIGGYRTAKESKSWLMGGVAGAGYVIVGTLLLALFLPIRGLGFIQVLLEGTFLGLVAGAFGAGKKDAVSSAWSGTRNQYHYTPSYSGYKNDYVSSSNLDWETEEEYTQRANPRTLQWMESSENEVPQSEETKTEGVVDTTVVKWPWDRVDENNITRREPKQVRNDLVVCNRGEEKVKPWWEQ